MRKTDISKYAGSPKAGVDVISTGKSIFRMIGKALLTVLSIAVITGVLILTSFAIFVFNLKDSSIDFDLHKLKLNYTSFIYVNGPGDNSAAPVKYASLSGSENRVWVDQDRIPKAMQDAIIAIEDKRFREHQGVDWYRTLGAAMNLFNFTREESSGSYGGSSITQQLIKNITGDKEVSLTRKITEIFRAINLEKKYSKDEILTAYLNVVPFGSGCNGVETAANLYFGKSISDCDIAQCAAIAGITQNPTAYNPLVHPEANKKRQQIVLGEMHKQGKITDAEYQTAMKESEHMVFIGKKKETIVDENSVWNWYTDAMFEDVKERLMEAYGISDEKAVDMIYHGGLHIYSAMNEELQGDAEKVFNNNSAFLKSYPNLQGGYFAMDYSGRVMAIVGGRGKKESNRIWNFATDSKRQPGSSIKPLADYGPAVNLGRITYSSILKDEPQENWKDGKPGPANADRVYHGNVTVDYALAQSLNAAAVQLCKTITPNVSYNFLKNKLNFTSLEPSDNTLAMAIGGLTEGVTVREMTAGYQIFGNGGKYYQPYTFYYVTDHDGNVIEGLDNRKEIPTQAISSSASSIMYRLLHNVMTNGLGINANISGWDTFGKTGTTNDNRDSWFVGGTPYAVAGVWTGYKTPKSLSRYETPIAKKIWKNIMSAYLKGKEKKKITQDPNVVSAVFCRDSGLLANPGVTERTGIGWYDKNNMPSVCSMKGEESSSPGDGESEGQESETQSSGDGLGSSEGDTASSSQNSESSDREEGESSAHDSPESSSGQESSQSPESRNERKKQNKNESNTP